MTARNTPEFWARHAILVALATIATALTGNVLYLSWIGFYVLCSWIGRVCHHRLKRRQRRAEYFTALAAFALRTVIFRGMVVYVWLMGEQTYQIMALCMMVGATLYAVAQLTRVPTFLNICVASDVVVFSIMALSGLMAAPTSPDEIMVFAALIGVIAYNQICIRNTRLMQISMREAELRSLQSQKLEALGQLTGGVAHDFNNILTVVIGNLELFQAIDSPSEKEKLAKDAHQAAERAAGLVAQLLAFSHKSQLIETEVVVADLFANVAKLAARTLPPSIKIEYHASDQTCIVKADVSQLESALLNLIINARDAMKGAGNIHLSARGMPLGPANTYGVEPGNYVLIDVRDNGSGIPENMKEQVFDPFFTTKAIGEGSGLGLSMVKGFSEQSGGGISMESTPGEGTTVSILLPCISAQDTRSRPT